MPLEFRCEDVGAVCGEAIKADTPEELVVKIAEHAEHEHGVPELSQTLVDYAKTVVRES